MIKEQPVVEISNQQTLDVEEQPLIDVVRAILEHFSFGRGEISIAIVDDPNMRELNNRYLEHDYETDVLSFVLDCDEDAGLLNGQLIVSADTAETNAAELGSTRQDELMLYVTHGTLHLVGLADKTKEDALEMRSAEREFLAPFGIQPKWSSANAIPGDNE